MEENGKSKKNRSVTLSRDEIIHYAGKLVSLNKKETQGSILNSTIHQDFFEAEKYLPNDFVDLLILDPPYNLYKYFNSFKNARKENEEYRNFIIKIIHTVKRMLKETASVYVCGEWRSSSVLQSVLEDHFIVRNRITWERDKGRGSKSNWKNNSEDIWYCTVSDDFVFNIEDVKLKRFVVAPYKKENGEPKDWDEDEINKGKGFRLTHPSNLWTDISVPFWSMRENTEHPTQKPEKLIAKLILASTNPGDVVFDPFLGAGTSSVTAKKLNRNFVGIEIDNTYCCYTLKRLENAETNKEIQGYYDGVFWERNTLHLRKKS